ncbi:hypothetical protein BurMR1_0766 [Burkholderia sp. MR1]|jgi:hypothetical protein|nr:hypothetical protein BurMR1_0766 [Burkholderia sp. MR1]
MTETLIERVQELIDRANKLRMKSVAIPVSELEELVRRCEVDRADRLVLAAKGRLNAEQDHALEKLAKRLYTLWR